MWNYEKRLQYPISISTPNAKMASFIISQYGGPDGEMGASMRYLSQNAWYIDIYPRGKSLLLRHFSYLPVFFPSAWHHEEVLLPLVRYASTGSEMSIHR